MKNKPAQTLFRYISDSSIYFFYFGAMGIFSAMLSVYLAGNEKSATEIAFIVTGASIFTMILQPLVGMVYDRLGKDWLVSILLLALSGAIGIQFVWWKNTILLFLFNGFTMAFLNSVSPVCERLATRSPFRYGVIRVWGAVGYAAGSQVSGLMFEYSDPALNFGLFAAAVVLTAIGFWNSREKSGPSGTGGNRAAKGSFHSWASLLTDPAFLLVVIFCFFFSGTTSANNTYLPLLLQELLGSTMRVGTVLAAATAMEIPVILLSHKFMDHFSGKALLAMNAMILLTQYAFYTFCPNAAAVCIAAMLCKSVATMLFIMVSLKVVLDISGEGNSTMALSLVASAKAFGGVAMTYLAGYLMDSFGLRAVYTALTGITLLLFLLLCPLKLPRKEGIYFAGK